jgi:hypothetical protein
MRRAKNMLITRTNMCRLELFLFWVLLAMILLLLFGYCEYDSIGQGESQRTGYVGKARNSLKILGFWLSYANF